MAPFTRAGSRCALFGLFTLTTAMFAPSALAKITIIAASGDQTPDQSGTYHYFGVPVLNNAGQVAFTTTIIPNAGDSNAAVMQWTGPTLSFVARKGEALDPNTTLSAFEQPSQSNAGHVAFFASFVDGVGDGRRGLLRGGIGNLVAIARDGQVAEGAAGTFVFQAADGYDGTPTMNDAGVVGFTVSILPDGRPAMYIGNGQSLTLVARAAGWETHLQDHEVSGFKGAGGGHAQGPR